MAWEIDFERSFGDPSPGRAERRIVNKSGRMILGTWVWEAAEEAISILSRALPESSNLHPAIAVRESFRDIADYVRDGVLAGFYPMLMEFESAGALQIRGEPPEGGVAAWWRELEERKELIERSRIFLQFVEQIPATLSEPGTFRDMVTYVAAACVVKRINDAAISVFCDGSGLDDMAADVRSFQHYLHLQDSVLNLVEGARIQVRIEAQQARSEQNRKNAQGKRTKRADPDGEIPREFTRLVQEGHTPREARGIMARWGRWPASTIRRHTAGL